jgi:hypothetical protein
LDLAGLPDRGVAVKPGDLAVTAAVGCNLWSGRGIVASPTGAPVWIMRDDVLLVLAVLKEEPHRGKYSEKASVFCLSRSGTFGWTWPANLRVLKW